MRNPTERTLERLGVAILRDRLTIIQIETLHGRDPILLECQVYNGWMLREMKRMRYDLGSFSIENLTQTETP